MSIFDNFNKRVMRGTNNSKELKTLQLTESFNKYLTHTPTGVTVPVTNPDDFPSLVELEGIDVGICHEEEIIVNDIVYNDKKALDEKYVKVKNNSLIDVGCYFFMDNSWWIIQFKDHKEINNAKRFTARRCNQFISYKYDRKIVKLPVSIENLTMYADGIEAVKYNSTLNAKRHIWYGSNPLSRTIKVGTRIMLRNSSVFMATHINDFEYNGNETGSNGLIKTLVSQCDLVDRDDLENGVAWNDEYKTIDYEFADIVGNIEVAIGSENTYVAKKGDNYGEEIEDCNGEWKIVNDEVNGQKVVTIEKQDSNSCKIKIEPNIFAVGHIFTLQYVVPDEETEVRDSLDILIKGV